MALSLLERGLAVLRAQGLPGDDAAWSLLHQQIKRYLKEIELWNPKLGLVEAAGDELVSKHILDCLAAFPLLLQLIETLEPGQPIAMADIGSGAGLPGIPLLLAMECLVPARAVDFSMTLVEKQQRRVGFLLNAKAILGLGRLTLRQEKVEDLARAGARFDVVCARAFSPLEPQIVAVLRSVLASRGRLFLYKGRLAKIDEELKAADFHRQSAKIPDIGLLPVDAALVIPLTVPFLAEERHIVIIPPGVGVC